MLTHLSRKQCCRCFRYQRRQPLAGYYSCRSSTQQRCIHIKPRAAETQLRVFSRAIVCLASGFACEPGQASALDDTIHGSTVPEIDAASPAEDGATRHSHGWQHDSRSSAELCGMTSNRDGSICLPNDEWDKRFQFSRPATQRRFQAKRAGRSACEAPEPERRESVLGARVAASSQEEGPRQGSDRPLRLH